MMVVVSRFSFEKNASIAKERIKSKQLLCVWERFVARSSTDKRTLCKNIDGCERKIGNTQHQQQQQ